MGLQLNCNTLRFQSLYMYDIMVLLGIRKIVESSSKHKLMSVVG